MNPNPSARTLPQRAFFFSLCGLLGLLLIPATAAALDLWKEKTRLDALRPLLPERELVELQIPAHPPLPALYRKTRRADTQGAAIILHPPGQHLDYPGPVHELRRRLPRFGWTTLSLQMPELHINRADAPLDEALQESSARLRAAVNFLNRESIQNIVIIGQGLSASYAVAFVTETALANPSVQALVTIGWPSYPHRAAWLDASRQLERLKLPLLDLYAELDREEVLTDLPRRLEAAHLAGQLFDQPLRLTDVSSRVQSLARRKSGNLRYRQMEIQGSDAFFRNQSDTLVKLIRGWIQRYAAGIQATIE